MYYVYYIAFLIQDLLRHVYFDARFRSDRHLAWKFRAASRPLRAAKRVVWMVGADYEAGDLARAKVETAIKAHNPSADVVFGAVGNFLTRQLGFYALVSMLAPVRHLPRFYVGYFNSAPIPKNAKHRNGGHAFLAVLLSNGRLVFSPNAGESLSYLLPYAMAVVEINAHDEGKQFRSWQCYPEAIGLFLSGNYRDVVTFYSVDEAIEMVPSLDGHVIAGIDNFGNLETDFSLSNAKVMNLRPGDSIEFSLDGQSWHRAVYGAGPGRAGEAFTFAPSSKIIEPEPGCSEQFHDIFVVGGEAAATLEVNAPGLTLVVRPSPRIAERGASADISVGSAQH